MVNVVNGSLGIDQFDEIFDNLYDILLGQHTHVHRRIKRKLAVDTVTPYLTQVITLV